MDAKVIPIARARSGRCREEPTSLRCTDRLRARECPGALDGYCRSPRLDAVKHNKELPKFFAAQQ